jgi:hypothetical protein
MGDEEARLGRGDVLCPQGQLHMGGPDVNLWGFLTDWQADPTPRCDLLQVRRHLDVEIQCSDPQSWSAGSWIFPAILR